MNFLSNFLGTNVLSVIFLVKDFKQLYNETKAVPDDRDAADWERVVLADGQRGLQALRSEALKADLVQLVQAMHPIQA